MRLSNNYYWHCQRTSLVLVWWCLLHLASAQISLINHICPLDSSGKQGTCTFIKDCPEALEAIKAHIQPYHCGFVDKDPIVCCGEPILTRPLNVATTEHYKVTIWPATTTTPKTSQVDVWGQTMKTSTLSNEQLDGDKLWSYQGTTTTNRAPPQQAYTERTTTANRQPLPTRQPQVVKDRPTSTTTARPSASTTTRKRNIPIGSSSSGSATTARPVSPVREEELPKFDTRTGNDGIKSKEKCLEYSELAFEESSVWIASTNKSATVRVPSCSGIDDGLKDHRARPKEFPHMAALGYGIEKNKKWLCGGVLVSNQFVLSAARCRSFNNSGIVRWVRLGDLNLRRPDDDAEPQEFPVKEIVEYPFYKPDSHYFDVMLLKLERKVRFSRYVRPACLDTGDIKEFTTYKAPGWGNVEADSPFDNGDLLVVNLENHAIEECAKAYPAGPKLDKGLDVKSQFCTNALYGSDVCEGDYGGPIEAAHPSFTCTQVVVGIASFGQCGLAPSVHTMVANYIPWLESVIWV